MPIALDATYSLGRELSGVGVYCREVLLGLCAEYSQQRFQFCYRPHRYFKSYQDTLPLNAQRYFLHDSWHVPVRAELFHGLNQRLPLKRMRRSICTFHDLFVMTGEYSTPEFRERFTQQAREAADRSDLIIAVSQHTADQVNELLGVDKARLRVIHHGVHPPSQPSLPREKIILHVGAIQKRKNVSRLIQAFAAVSPEWQLVLAGSAGYDAEAILRGIEDSPARTRIAVTGYVSPAKLEELYRKASIFAFPSLDEGFGMPVLEAMAHGVPVLSSNRSAMPEVCGEAALLVDPLNQAELEHALVQLSADQSLRENFVAKGLKRAAMFTWKTAVQKTWAVYQELRS